MKWGSDNIGKIMWGTSEIGKVYFGSDLVYQKSTPLPDNYVTDGLVLWLDGIDKGGTTNHWIDKVNSVDFAADTGKAPTALSNCFEFSGSQYFYNTAFTPSASASGTIEIVFETTSASTAQTVFIPKSGATRMAFYFSSTGRIVIAGGSSTNRKTYNATISTDTKMSFSVNNAAGYQNGTSMTTGSNTYLSGATSYNYIGKRRSEGDSSGNNYFTGKIYSIRIYNRQLSAAEVATNLAIDNARFKMGLNLS